VELESTWDEFFQLSISPRLYSGALELIRAHQAAGRSVYIVSNSVEFIVKRVASLVDADGYRCTRLDVRDDRYTGEIRGEHMYGLEKAAAIHLLAADTGIREANIWCYADHGSDADILQLVGHPFPTNPNQTLLSIARRHDWQVVHFNPRQTAKL